MLEPHSTPPSDARESWIPTPPNVAAWGQETVRATRRTIATLAPAEDCAPVTRERGDDSAGTPFRLHERIAMGGMGEVWAGMQESLGRVVAIKRIRHDRIAHAKDEHRNRLTREFHNEALVAAALEHPNIAPVYDFGADEGGAPLLAMKMVKGMPWNELLEAERGSLPMEDFLARHLPILVSMGQAVAFAHARGIVQRDLKPAQVMVGEFGEALLMDWGLAVHCGASAGEPAVGSALALPGVPTPDTATNPAGTPALMAPEQTDLDARGIGPHTDVFLLGGTLYYILCGSYPFESDEGSSALELARAGHLVPIEDRTAGRNAPPELVATAMRALSREKARRHPSAREFVAEVQAYLSGDGRRRQASERVAVARRLLDAPDATYATLASAQSALGEAARHWPAHAEIEPLREECLARQAELALAEGDLAFARVQAGALAQGPRRESLAGRVRGEEARRTRRKGLLRVASAAAVVLALVAAGVSTAFAATTRRKNEELAKQKALVEEQRAAADAGRAAAERARSVAMTNYEGTGRLVGYMLQDLRKSLDLSLEHDVRIVRDVAIRSSEYYLSAGTDDMDRDLLVEHANQLVDMVRTYSELGIHEDAVRLGDSALELRTRLFGADSIEVGEVLSFLGGPRRELGSREQGLAELARSVELLDGHVPEGDDRLVIAISNHASALVEEGRGAEAILLMRRALAAREATPGKYPGQVVTLRHNLAGALIELDELREAAELLEEQAAYLEANMSGNERALITHLYMQANLVRKSGGTPEQVLPHLERALELSRSVNGPDHPHTTTLLNNVAMMWQRTGRGAEALAAFEQLYEMRRARYGENHAETAVVLNNIGMTHDVLGDEEKALEWFLRAKASFEAAVGPDGLELAPVLGNISLALAARGRFAEAEAEARRGLRIREGAYGPRHPGSLNSRVKLLAVTVQWARHGDGAGDSAAQWAAARDLMAEFRGEALRVPPVAAHVAEALLRTGDRAAAMEYARAAAAMGFGTDADDEDQVAFAAVCAELGVELAPAP